MVHRPGDAGMGYGTSELQVMLAEHELYRTTLGVIHHTATVAAQCPCCLVVARVAGHALAPPVARMEYWRHCEA